MELLEQLLSPVITNSENLNVKTMNDNDMILMHKIKKQKMDVLQKHISPSHANLVRPEIIASWIRSAENGLDPDNYNYPPNMDQRSFAELLKEKAYFIQAAEPYIRQLENILSNVECYIVLSDEQGVILRIAQALGKNKFRLLPGSIWTEETIGTCSHGMSIRLKRPIQLCGSEHFSHIFEHISCSSAPVFDANGNLAGTLTIANPTLHSQNSHSLGLVVTMARAIQMEFQLSVKTDLLSVALATTNDAIIVIDNAGLITVGNMVAISIFGPQIVGSPINDILGSQPLIKSVIDTGKPELNIDIQIKKQKVHLCSIQPVINNDSKNIGCILTLKTTEPTRSIGKSPGGFATRFTFDKIVGSSPQSMKSINLAKKFARFDTSILIQGESGTGKEVYAQAIHKESRPDGPFIAVNCAAIPRNLIESELFGYESGAFTGADRQGKPGKIELANGGTLFLDEIADMPMELQAILLRVLEDKMVVHVGGSRYIPVDFRLVTATNKDLLDLVEKGQFREDLYYRISVFKIGIPPLKTRGEDIIQLAEHFVKIAAETHYLPAPSLSNAAKYILLQYNWPGNVRQLQNAILYAVCMSSNDGIIRPEHFPAEIMNYYTASALDPKQAPIELSTDKDVTDNNLSMKDIEKMVIQKALDETKNHIRDAAKILGLSKSTLYRKIKEYELTVS